MATTPSVTFLVMTVKGVDVLKQALSRHAGLVARVVVGEDPHLVDDGSAAIRDLCRNAGVRCVPRREAPPITTPYAIAVSWRWMIDASGTNLIVLHDSLLPRYRGFAPLPNALINGESEIGVTALHASEEYDRGDIIFQASTPVRYPLTIQEAITLNNRNYRALVGRILEHIESGTPLPRIPQDEGAATYSIWRDGEDYRIDWARSAEEIARFVDALGPPYAGAFTVTKAGRVKVLAAEPRADVACEIRHPGKTIFVEDGCPVVICGKGLLKITAAKAIDASGRASDFLPVQRFRMRFCGMASKDAPYE